MKSALLRVLCIFISSLVCHLSSNAGSISGNITYDDDQTGPVHVVVTQTSDGNRALKLDGDGDYVVVSTVTDLSGPEVSVQYWFRGSSIQSAVRQQSGGWIVAGWNNQHIISNDGGVNGISAGNATDGNWHHLVLTWKQGAPNGFASYLDGRLVESRDAADDPIPLHNAPLYFGAFQGQFEFSNGELDEIAVWRRALTPEEVQQNWYRKLTGDEEGLVGYWTFDDDTPEDASPNEHHGEFMGDAVTVEADIPGLDAFFATELSEPGAYEIADIPNGSGYQLSAFLDADGDGQAGDSEPAGVFSGNPFSLSGDQNGMDIRLIEKPQITEQPSSIRIGAGEALTLSVAAIGSKPLAYQWRANGQDLQDGGDVSGAQSATLSITNAGGARSGVYNCVVSNDAGEVTSDSASVQVIEGGLSISGQVTYEGTREGEVLITAAQVQRGNKVLSLDGDGDYALTPLTDISGTELTIQYWFRGSSIQSAVRQQGAAYIVAGWNGMHILSFDGGTIGISAGEEATDGNWHQLVMTWKPNSPGGFSSYLDGRLVERRDSAEGEIPNMATQVYFGAFNGVGEFASGQLDEIAIWERALSEGEIAGNWNNPLTGSEAGLLGFWNFDDGTGRDLSDGGNTAELHGDAAIVDESIPGLGGAVFEGAISGPGPFELRNILPGNNFELTAFLDLNGNGGPDDGEPSGAYSGNLFSLSEALSGIEIELTEPPRILAQPSDARAGTGGAAELAVDVAGSAPISFQWMKDGVALSNGGGVSGATSAVLSIGGASAQDSGGYSVLISNAKGEITSRNARLDVVSGGESVSGNVAYTGVPEGKIHLTAAQFLPGNQALTLDGRNDFVVVPSLTDLSGFEISIQYWFKGRSLQSAVRQQGGAFLVAGWNGLHIISVDGGVGGIKVGDEATDGRWHHVMMTWEIDTENGFRSYLDGQLVDQRQSSDAELPFQDAPLYFGAFNGVGEFAEGQLDEIAIWTRALSEEEIRAQWNQPLNGDEEGLLGLWKFDDGTASDSTGNQFDGELSGDAAIVAANIPGFGGGAFSQVIEGPGAYTLTDLPKGGNYHVFGFVDVNGNFVPDADEPAGESGANPFELSAAVTGIDLDLGGEVSQAVRLDIAFSDGAVTISWPDSASGAKLFATDDLAGGEWVEVVFEAGNQVTLTADQAAQYYQLR